MSEQDRMLCEVCGKKPARRADQEYREAHPDDIHAVMCDDCDTATGGRTPPRPRRSMPKEEEDRTEGGAVARLEFQAEAIRIEFALWNREIGKTNPDGPYAWTNQLSGVTLENCLSEIAQVVSRTQAVLYMPYGPARCRQALEKIRSICVTYQLMAGVGSFSGIDPRTSDVKDAQIPEEVVQ